MKKLLTKLFEHYYQDVYTYLYSMCRDASLAEDLASETFLEIVKSIATFRGESDIKTWIFSIARRQWFACLRRRGREPLLESIHELCDVLTDTTHPADAMELAERIRDLLRSEPPLTQKIVQMRLDGYAYYEIAAKENISENSARVIYFRARNRIRKQLEKEGFHYE